MYPTNWKSFSLKFSTFYFNLNPNCGLYLPHLLYNTIYTFIKLFLCIICHFDLEFIKISVKTMTKIEFKPIGTIHSPFKDLDGMPIQPVGARGIKGEIKLNKKYKDGLKDLEGFSHIILIYFFHLSSGYSLEVKPFLDTEKRGIFATRAPKRPNPIGVSVVRLEKIEGTKIYISDVDIADGTPLLDIKPYIPNFDKHDDDDIKIGWFENKHHKAVEKKSDRRFLD